ncbi:NACHT domain-containing protein [Lentzea sp. NPDC102401]|uniref:NACHT domain-containing protein n=1 Tax=Lentzea sp. NPDC102401 TaxID=3364128 RepID=UPI00381578DB
MSELANITAHVAVVATNKLVRRDIRDQLHKGARDAMREVMSSQESAAFVEALNPACTEAIGRYLKSPDFEEVTRQFALWRLLTDRTAPKDVQQGLREAVHLGLGHAGHWRPDDLVTAAKVVYDQMRGAVMRCIAPLQPGDVDQAVGVSAAQLANAAIGNNNLLMRVESLAAFHSFARRMGSQVRSQHAEMRMPHLGMSRSVSYDRLYVKPSLGNLEDITLPGRRSVILGDPGAGKSTLVAKMAWEVASAKNGRVPFLVVLRNFTSAFRAGGVSLVSHLEAVCREPYGLEPPPDAVEYLLRNGRAVVLLDGVDELIDPDVRQRFARLVESFAELYPLVPLVVTARKIGYEIAPLNPRSFQTAVIEEFDDPRVNRYVRSWFVLDSSTPVNERPKLAQSFLRESESLGELRKNPLMLALLCAMYSSEHYLPTNLAQAYEKCALMMFDQWDRMRDLPMPTRFESHLRGAVGYLAWRQLTAENSGTAWPRGRIVAMLTQYLERKGFDAEEAEDNANRFVDFCTGRPWVLTDTGTGQAELRYGFTHRTFLEFFAADHLVRTNRTAGPLWAALRPILLKGSGGVVPQIALQLYDQKHDDGASDLLRLVVEEGSFLSTRFAAESLRYIQPSPQATRAVVRSAVRLAAGHPVENRFHYWLPWQVELYQVRDDEPLTILGECSRNNRSAVEKALDAELDSGEYETGLANWLRYSWFGPRPRRNRPKPWASVLHSSGDLSGLVEEFGPHVLYLCYWSPQAIGRSLAQQMLMGTPLEFDPEVLLRARLPWLDGGTWWKQRRLSRLRGDMITKEANMRHSLLALPFLETAIESQQYPQDVRRAQPSLGDIRQAGGRVDLRHLDLPDNVREFLEGWCRRDFSVVGPATEEGSRRERSGMPVSLEILGWPDPSPVRPRRRRALEP